MLCVHSILRKYFLSMSENVKQTKAAFLAISQQHAHILQTFMASGWDVGDIFGVMSSVHFLV